MTSNKIEAVQAASQAELSLGRNYVAEMDEHIKAITGRSTERGFVPAVQAQDLVLRLASEDPELLLGWLQVRAMTLVRYEIRNHLRRAASRARHQAAAEDFSARAKKFAADGDPAHLSIYFTPLAPGDEKGTRKRTCDMTGTEILAFTRATYFTQGRRLLMLDAFYTAVGHKAGTNLVSEVFTEEEFTRLYRSITGDG